MWVFLINLLQFKDHNTHEDTLFKRTLVVGTMRTYL